MIVRLTLDLAVLVGFFLVEILVEPDQLLAAADVTPPRTTKRASRRPAVPRSGDGVCPCIDPVRRARAAGARCFLRVGLKLLHVSKVVDADSKLDQM